MKKIFKEKNFSIALALLFVFMTVFSFVGTKTTVYAKYSPEQKILIKDINGVSSNNGYVTTHPVPSNWNPLTATNEELKYYGYPQRPTNQSELNQWKKIVTGKWIKPNLTKTNIKHNVM